MITRVFCNTSEFLDCRKPALTLFGNCHILPPHANGNGIDRDHEWRARRPWRLQQIRSDNPRGWVCIRKGARVFLRTAKGAAGMDARRCFSIFPLVSACTIYISACKASGHRGDARLERVQSLPEMQGVLCPPGTWPFRGPFYAQGAVSRAILNRQGTQPQRFDC